jgi:hypothetical protein
MNVGELRNILAEYEEDVPVFLSKDEEGNAFHELADVAYEGAIHSGWGELDFYDEDEGHDPADYGAVIVLWP